MALTLGDNFSYQGAKPLDGRLTYNTVAEMKAVADATMYNGCLAYCVEADKTYQWKSTNTVDETLGRWREFSSGGGSSYTAGNGIDITNDVISTKQSEEGDIDEIIDVYPQAGNLVSIVNAFNKGDIYSTQERMIGQWIDLKPLYAKTFDVGALPNNSCKSVSTGLTNENVKIIKGVATASWGAINLPHITTQSIYNVELSYEDHSIKICTGTDRSSLDGFVTIYYTKTTDTAISIGETTEYSTDEKVVGTWLDEKPIWQKTISCGQVPQAVTSGTRVTKEVAHGVTNIDRVVNLVGSCYATASSHPCPPIMPVQLAMNNTNTPGINIRIDATNIYIVNSNTAYNGIQEVCVTIQYTKTTS